jgi:glycyl-tRNA synthetase
MKLHPAIAPVKCAILPLVKNKAELVEKAQRMFDDLKYSVHCQYDEKDAIGRRYRRQDAIGTPYCLTVDFDTLKDNTVTIRERDSLAQERIPIAQAGKILREKTDFTTLLKSIG